MKKEKSYKSIEFQNKVIETLKNMIAPFVFMLVIGIVVLILSLVKFAPEEEENIRIHKYEGEETEFVLENDKLKFVLDAETTQFELTVKSTGEVWHSSPTDVDSDPIALPNIKDMLKSTLILKYSNQTGLDTPLDSYTYSIMNKVYDIEATDDYVKVYYTVGKVQKEYIIPQVISVDRMNELSAKIVKDMPKAKNYIDQLYIKYDINKPRASDNKEELLKKYPLYAETPIYVIRDRDKEDAKSSNFESVKKVLEPAFEAAGYTLEDYNAELEEFNFETSNDKPVFNVSVIYRLDGEDLVVDVPLAEIEHKKDYPVIELSILPYFGAAGKDETGYILVPEGGGSIINFNNGRTSQSDYYSNVYGWDMALSRKYLVHDTRTYFGVFGMAKEKSSFICILEDGSSYAGINAGISGKVHSYNYAYASHTIMHRDKIDIGSRKTGDMFMYEENIADEHIINRYCFVPSTSYVDMANAYNKYLTEKYGAAFTKNSDAHVPVTVEIVGAVDKVKQIFGIPVSKPLAVTTYKEAQEILNDISASGVRGFSVKLSGWMNGGVRQKVLNSTNLIGKLGSKKDFTNLLNYASQNNIQLYLDGVTNYAYKSNFFNGFLTFRDAATYASRKRVKLLPFDPVDYAPQKEMDSYYLLKPSLVIKMMGNLASSANKYKASGVSFADVGYQLSADYNRKSNVTREQALSDQVAKLNEIKSSGMKVMTNMGNDYTLGVTDNIVNMDLNGAEYAVINETVPFYQIAIHGYVNYAGEPLNLTENYEDELLKSVEYGAGLYVTFMKAPITTLQNTYYTQYFGANYDAWRDRFLEIYNKYESSLGKTFNQRIVDHEILYDGVTLTVYEDGTKVYVNYRYEDYKTDNGVLLPARDYVVQ